MTKLYGSGVIAQEVVQYDGDGNVVSPGAITSITLPTAIYNGQETVDSAGTAQAIGSSQALTSGVKIKAMSDNDDVVYVGSSSVDSTNGFVLAASEEVFIEVDNVAKVYIDSETNDDGVSWIGS